MMLGDLARWQSHWKDTLDESSLRYEEFHLLVDAMDVEGHGGLDLIEEIPIRLSLLDEAVATAVSDADSLLEARQEERAGEFLTETTAYIRHLSRITHSINDLLGYYNNVLRDIRVMDIADAICDEFADIPEPEDISEERYANLRRQVAMLDGVRQKGATDQAALALAHFIYDIGRSSSQPFTSESASNGAWWKRAIWAYLDHQ